jgi:long-subunit fatty acid transport protein
MLPGLLGAQQSPLDLGITLPPSLNFAASPNPVGSGARAQGQAIAFIGVADDATAASHNPGGLVQLERPEMSVVGSFFLRHESPSVTEPGLALGDQQLSNFDLNYLSVAYPFQLFRRNVVVSLNFQRLFGLRGTTDAASRYTTVVGTQQVDSEQDGGLFTISPAVAVQITPTFSAGIAFNFWPNFLNNGWEQDITVQGEGRVVSGNRIVPFVANGRIKEDYAFSGFNITTGFLWNITSVWSLGGVFRSPFTAKVTRSHTSALTVTLQDDSEPLTTGLRFRETLDMDMPLSYGLGVSARLSDNLTVSLDVGRIHWSDFRLEESTQDDTLLVDNGAPSGKGQAVLNGESDDVTTVRLGAEYLWIRPKFVLALRGGGFYDPEPGAGGIDEFFGFSVGSGITLGKLVIDVAYTFRAGTVESDAADTAVSQHGVLASAIYHF